MRAGGLVLVACALGAVACTSSEPRPTGLPTGDRTTAAATPTDEPPASPTSTGAESPGTGVVTYAGPDERLYRIEATAGASPEDISSRLAPLGGEGQDEWINVASDGSWLLVSTARFGCADLGACMVVVPADVSRADIVGGTPAESQDYGDFGAVAPGGGLVVFEWSDGPNETDLWAIRRDGTSWDDPVLLTGDSPHAYNAGPVLPADPGAVLFNCGASAYAQEGTGICRVEIGGTGFEQLVRPDQGPGASPEHSAHSPGLLPDGSVVFEADWQGGENLWRLPPDGRVEQITSDFPNDNSPCVLPDGRIASLWLGRPDGPGLHELKVMSTDGSDHVVLVPGVDIMDIGLGCGGG